MSPPSPQPASLGGGERGRLLRPDFRRPPDRHVRLGVSHASGDPAQHRTFEIRASYDAARQGWVASVGEQNLNDQRGAWVSLTSKDQPTHFPTAAACLGAAVAIVVTTFDRSGEAIP